MVFVLPLAVGKNKKLRRFVNTIDQFTNAWSIAAFTSENQWMTIKKNLFRNCPLMLNFFVAHLSTLVQSKTNGAVGIGVRLF
jgi:hypothetical protein